MSCLSDSPQTAKQRHIITCEFPPTIGGVSDFVYFLASGLAATGDDVHVWCPKILETGIEATSFTIHRNLGKVSAADLRQVGTKLNRFDAPRWLLIQWVPHGYGYRSLNLWFCLWVLKRAAIDHDHVELMVHEPFLSFWEGTWKQTVAAAVHRIMVTILLAASSKVWLSTWAWEPKLRPYALNRNVPFRCLPTPNNIPIQSAPETVAFIRSQYMSTGTKILLGHFGTYGGPISEILAKILLQLFEKPGCYRLMLLGKGSQTFHARLIEEKPDLANEIVSTGPLTQAEVSYHVQACDLMIQPYPDGISSRRTSVMVCLAHSRPVVTTTGHLTEQFWKMTNAVALAPAQDIRAVTDQIRKLVHDESERDRLGKAAGLLHSSTFDLSHSIAALQAN